MNHKILTVLLAVASLLMLAADVFAYPVEFAVPSTGLTKQVSEDNPLPVNALVTIGSVTVDPAAPVSANSTTVLSVTSSAQSVASLANRKSVAFINQSASVMGWISLDSAVASAAVGIGIPLPPYGFFSTELDSAKIVGVAADGVASITVYQDGY